MFKNNICSLFLIELCSSTKVKPLAPIPKNKKALSSNANNTNKYMESLLKFLVVIKIIIIVDSIDK